MALFGTSTDARAREASVTTEWMKSVKRSLVISRQLNGGCHVSRSEKAIHDDALIQDGIAKN